MVLSSRPAHPPRVPFFLRPAGLCFFLDLEQEGYLSSPSKESQCEVWESFEFFGPSGEGLKIVSLFFVEGSF